ncbi:MAG: DUF484 family protein [Gammaproteobacteria bacterium]|nr:DUF484 family protein [Gammaproteobacteria bacterium]NNJ98050.1 DUF484 family protein [Gammaproteobacteria bacterium]
MSTQAQKKQQESLDAEQQLLELLSEYPDILVRNPAVLADLEVPHQSGTAVSLIEKQVSVLRNKLNTSDTRLRELMDIARDNERLAKSCHRLAINLLGAADLEDVISIALDELGNELDADFTAIRLITDDDSRLDNKPKLFIGSDAEQLRSFTTMLDNRKPLCGRCTPEQKAFLFGNDAEQVGSAAVIPLVAGARLGLLGLGGSDQHRFSIAMGTEFLTQIGDLVSATLAIHLQHDNIQP